MRGFGWKCVWPILSPAATNSTAGADLMTATFDWTLAGASHAQRARAVLANGGFSKLKSARLAGPEFRGDLPSPQGCELLLAIGLGELARNSIHADPWRQSPAALAALAKRWRARGDETPMGRLRIECLQMQGLLPALASP